jgi:hypothetical protein
MALGTPNDYRWRRQRLPHLPETLARAHRFGFSERGWISTLFNTGKLYYQGGQNPYFTIAKSGSKAFFGDWIVEEQNGWLRAMKDDAFNEVYELLPVDEIVQTEPVTLAPSEHVHMAIRADDHELKGILKIHELLTDYEADQRRRMLSYLLSRVDA